MDSRSSQVGSILVEGSVLEHSAANLQSSCLECLDHLRHPAKDVGSQHIKTPRSPDLHPPSLSYQLYQLPLPPPLNKHTPQPNQITTPEQHNEPTEKLQTQKVSLTPNPHQRPRNRTSDQTRHRPYRLCHPQPRPQYLLIRTHDGKNARRKRDKRATKATIKRRESYEGALTTRANPREAEDATRRTAGEPGDHDADVRGQEAGDEAADDAGGLCNHDYVERGAARHV